MNAVQLVARMTEALTEARTSITADRQTLWSSTVNQDTGKVDEDEAGPIDEYDRVLGLIDDALDSAKNGE